MRLATFILASLVATLASVAPAQDFGFDILGIQNEDFFLPPPVAQIALEPSGQRVAYLRRAYDRDAIHLLDTASGDDRELAARLDPDPLVHLDWLDSNRLVFQTANGSIYLQRVDNGLITEVFHSKRLVAYRNALLVANTTRPRILSLLPDDPERILVSAFDDRGVRRVYRLPLKRWSPDNLPEPLHPRERDFDFWEADPSGDVRLAMKLRQNGTSLYHRPSGSDRWTSFDALLRHAEQALELDVSKRNIAQPRDVLLGFAFHPDRLYVSSNKQTDTAAIYLYDIAENRVVEQIAHHPQFDLIDTATGLARLVLSPKKRALVGVHYEGEYPSTLWLDPEYQDLQAAIDQRLPDSRNRVVDWDDEETTCVVAAIWSRRPHRYYLYDRSSGDLRPIGKDTHPLAAEPGPASEPIAFSARDGQTLRGYFTPAKSPHRQPAPLVMLVHGGPWARDTFGYDPFVQCLAHNGFSVLQINFRGSTGYGYQHFAAAAKNYGWAVQEDLADARAWAIETGRAAPDRVAIMGFSFGGYAAALAAATAPDSYQCAIPISGIYDLVYETRQIKKQSGGGVTYEYWKQMVGSDWNEKQQLARISPVNLAKQIEIPLLIAHGALDPVASVEHARMLRDALQASGATFDYIELEEEAHALDLPKNQAYLFDTIEDFLATHLAAVP